MKKISPFFGQGCEAVTNILKHEITKTETCDMIEMGTTKMFPGHTVGGFQNSAAFAALCADGFGVMCGDRSCVGDSSGVASSLGDMDVTRIFSTDFSEAIFTALGAAGEFSGSEFLSGAGLVADQNSS